MPVSSWVNSVEFIDAVISGSNNSATYNLSKGQNYNYCVPFFTVCGDSTYWDNRLTDVYFSGTTQSGIINFERSANRSTSNYVKCYVVEFNPEQVRVQQGAFSLTGTTTQTVTLPTTIGGTDRAAMTFGWKSSDTTLYTSRIAVRGRVLNTTSIDFYRCDSTSTCAGHWFLFEDLGDNFRTYHVSDTNTKTIDISGQKTVDPLKTFVLGSYASNSANPYPSLFSARIFLYSIGTVRCDRASGTYSIYWAAQIVEILDQTKVYVPMDHALVGWTSPTTYSRSVGGISGRVPFTCNPQTSTIVTASMQGFVRGENNTPAGLNSCMTTAEITAGGTITHTKFGIDYTVYPSYTVAVDWAGISVDTGSNPSPIPKGNGSGQSFVKSVENFRFTLSGNTGVYILTKGQTVANCAIFSSNRSVSSTTLNTICVNTYLKEPGLVYMQHWSDTEQAIVDVSVVEFYPDQVRVQQFNINNSSATTINVPISEISSINKAFILSSVFTPYGGGPAGFQYSFYKIKFTSTTNVELYKVSSGYEVICSFSVVEDLQDNFVVEHCDRSFNSSDSFYTETYNWGGHNSFPIVTYTANTPDNYPGYGCIRAYYHSEFRPIYCEKGTGTYSIYWVGTMVKFVDNKRHTLSITTTLSNPNSLVQYYPSEMRNTENITAYNVVQYSTIGNANNSSAGVSESFGTITITDYNTGSYEVSKGVAVSYTSYIGAHIIDWIGYHYQDANNVVGTKTKSFINSIQKDYFNTNGNYMQIWLRYNQNINKCVPFMSNSGGSSDNYTIRLLKTIYRYDDPDCFRIRFIANNTSYRQIMSYIVEFNDDIKVQYGSGYSNGTSKTFDIDAVNLRRSFLVFYANSDSWQKSFGSSFIYGYFSSSTQLTFVRNTANESMYISWYVVECPEWGTDSYWNVYSNTGSLGSGSTVYSWFTVQPAIERTIFLSSYTTDEPNGYPSYGMFRIFNRQDHGLQLDRGATPYNMTGHSAQAIEFLPSIVSKGFKVYSNFYTLSSPSSIDVSLRLNSDDYFHIQRSMVLCGHNENLTRVDNASSAGVQESYHYMEFKDTTGSGYSNAISISKIGSTYASYGFYYAIQFPKYNKYYFSGYVTEQGDPVSRKVAAYKYSTGELVDYSTSISGTGYFYLETTDYGPHYVVAIDDEDGFSYNDLIYGKIYPEPIEGAFAWIADSPTFTGIGEYYAY